MALVPDARELGIGGAIGGSGRTFPGAAEAGGLAGRGFFSSLSSDLRSNALGRLLGR